MNKNVALIVSGLIFSLVTIFHAVRYFLHVSVVISGYVVPLSVSLYGFIVTLALAIWMFAASRMR